MKIDTNLLEEFSKHLFKYRVINTLDDATSEIEKFVAIQEENNQLYCGKNLTSCIYFNENKCTNMFDSCKHQISKHDFDKQTKLSTVKEIKINKGDEVKLINGISGKITDIDYAGYRIKISDDQWYHILNIKLLNDIDVEFNTALYL